MRNSLRDRCRAGQRVAESQHRNASLLVQRRLGVIGVPSDVESGVGRRIAEQQRSAEERFNGQVVCLPLVNNLEFAILFGQRGWFDRFPTRIDVTTCTVEVDAKAA